MQGKHCIAYDFMTSRETYEWYNLRQAVPEECIVSAETVPVAELARRNTTGV